MRIPVFDFRIASKGQPWYSAQPRSCSAAALQGECTRSRSVRTSARQIRPLRQSPSLPPRPFFTFRLFEFNGGHAHGELMLTPSFANRVDVLHHQLIHAMETGEIPAPHRGRNTGARPGTCQSGLGKPEWAGMGAYLFLFCDVSFWT